LTDKWQTFDIPLSSFSPTRMEELFNVASFIVENQAYAIEVETIQFFVKTTFWDTIKNKSFLYNNFLTILQNTYSP